MWSNTYYPVVVFKEGSSGKFYARFPDFLGAFTEGNTVDEVLMMAEDCLDLAASSMLDENKVLPKPTVLGIDAFISSLVEDVIIDDNELEEFVFISMVPFTYFVGSTPIVFEEAAEIPPKAWEEKAGDVHVADFEVPKRGAFPTPVEGADLHVDENGAKYSA